jgi:lactoylglutathione lyase
VIGQFPLVLNPSLGLKARHSVFIPLVRNVRSKTGLRRDKKQKENTMAKLIHSMVRVLEEKRSVEFYTQVLGLEIAERVEFENFTLIYLSNSEGDFELELTVNRGREVPYALGDGYGHLAVSVADVDAEHQRLIELGLSPGKIIESEHKGQPFAKYFFICDPDGYKIEVLQRGNRFK